MAQRAEIRDVTIPPGTLLAAPQVTALVWRQGFPSRVEFRFPPGPSGLVGVQLMHSGVVIVPRRGSGFLVADNETVGWDLEDLPAGPAWALRGYNTGSFPHTIQIRMLLNEVGRQGIVRVPQVPIVVPVTSPGLLAEGLEV